MFYLILIKIKRFQERDSRCCRKIVNESLDNDQDKLWLMTPALEKEMVQNDKNQGDADTLNQTRDKSAPISDNFRNLGSVGGKDKDEEVFRNRKRQKSSQNGDGVPSLKMRGEILNQESVEKY